VTITRQESFGHPETGEEIPVSVRTRWVRGDGEDWLCVFFEAWTKDGNAFPLTPEQAAHAEESAWEEVRVKLSLFR